jgi:predicted RNA binding protein YcfA (HicA-like mRNA interferase family)
MESADGKSLTVPRHDEIRRGTLLTIIEETGLTKEEFLKLLG